MTRQAPIIVLLAALVIAACEEPKPTMTGRLSGPADLEVFKGCPQSVPGCEQTTESKHLLLVANSLADDLKVFEVEGRGFFKATNPLFPFSIPVGRHPRNLALGPYEEFAFVVNALSENVSVVNLAPNRMVEVDTDWDTCTSFCGPCKDAGDQPVSYGNARCRAGVSRVSLGSAEGLQPEDIVTFSRTGVERDSAEPLPVYVSLTGTGQVAVLQFFYPGMYPGYPQRMDLVYVIDIDPDARPAGLALTQDGTTLFAADEASDSIIVIDTATMTPGRIPVGGPTRRVFLSPDDSVLYAVQIEEGRISLIDVATQQKRPPGDARIDALDPRGLQDDDLKLPGVPRSLAFVQGVPILMYDDAGVIREYTTELQTTAELEEIRLLDPEYLETIVKTFAYVSDPNGNTYIIDAENHRMVDIYPFAGPSTSSAPAFAIDGTLVDAEEEWDPCYPQIAETDVVHSIEEPQEREIDGDLWRIYNGVWVRPGATRDESWLIEWEGFLPGTGVSTSGHFAGWRLEDDRVGLDFIENFKAKPGDILEIIVDPTFTGGANGDHPCWPGAGGDEVEEVQYEFVVTTVEINALELEPVAGMDPEVCWAEALRYNLRAGATWIVWGSESGFVDRLTMAENTGEAPDPPAYNNGKIALTMYAPPAVNPITQEACGPVRRGMAWGFNSEDGFTGASFNPSVQAGIAGSLVSIDLDDDLEAGNLGDDRIFLLFEGSNAMMEFFPGSLESSNYIIYQ